MVMKKMSEVLVVVVVFMETIYNIYAHKPTLYIKYATEMLLWEAISILESTALYTVTSLQSQFKSCFHGNRKY